MLKFMFAFISWLHLANGAANVNWSFNDKLITIKNSLICNKNLEKFSNISHNDNYPRFDFQGDENKAKRSYENARCIKDLKWIQGNINNGKNRWAFELFDTWGNLPYGDAVRDLGNYKKCQEMQPMISDSLKIQSQFCFLDIDISPLGAIEASWNTSQLGICIPDSCAPTLIKTMMDEYLNASNLVRINIPAELCQLKGDNAKLFLRDKLMLGFIISVLLLVVSGTIYEATSAQNGAENSMSTVLLAFSALSNGKALFSFRTVAAPNVFHFFHGIRVISCTWIIYGHIITEFKVSTNYNEFVRFKFNFYKHTSGGTPLSVDTFLVLGGILASISILKRLSQSNNQVSFCSLIFQRFWRFFPVLAFVTFFQLTLFKFFMFGPFRREIDYLRYGCEKDAWKTLLFINNYLENNCVVLSWYASLDMQLFIFAPFLLTLAHRSQKRFVIVSILLILIDFIIVINGGAIWNKDLHRSRFYTHYRFPAWLIGLNFGYFLHKYRDRKVFIPKDLNILGLIGSLNIMGLLAYFFHDVSRVHIWLFRIVWSLALCYIIFACAYGHGGIINWFLSLPMWQPFSRLSFVTYLIGRITIFATSQNAHHFSKMAFFQHFLLIIGVANVAAIVISLMIEMPLVKLKPRLFMSDFDLKSRKLHSSK